MVIKNLMETTLTTVNGLPTEIRTRVASIEELNEPMKRELLKIPVGACLTIKAEMQTQLGNIISQEVRLTRVFGLSYFQNN